MALIRPGSVAPEYHSFSITGLDNVDSIFIDGHFEDASSRKAFCWKYFLIDKAKGNEKAKCKYCDKVLVARGGTTTPLNFHLKSVHGIDELSTSLGLD